MTIGYALEQLEQISAVTHEAGIGWVAGISMAFGSPYGDESRPDDILRLVDRCVALGPEHLYVADSIGAAGPAWVHAMCSAIRERWPELSLAVHLHGAGERGLACAVAAVRAGAGQVETSICGLGGPVIRSPDAPLVGNLATEAVVARFDELGIDTGLDPGALQDAARDVANLLRLPHLEPASPR
jgi:hydroxymethylglutaryl-CoA lyase